MPSYEATEFDPPAPVALVTLRDSTGTSVADVAMLIDSDADVTLLPRAAVTTLGTRPVAGLQYELVGFDGTRSKAEAVEVDLIFLRRVFRGRYLLIDGTRGIVGRDVLAGVAMVLNGSKQEWSELVSP
jgi:hypothetical protein